MITDMDFSLRDEVKALDSASTSSTSDRPALPGHHRLAFAGRRRPAPDIRMSENGGGPQPLGRYATNIAGLIDDFEEGRRSSASNRCAPCPACYRVSWTMPFTRSCRGDAEKASHLHERDDAVDALYDTIFRDLDVYDGGPWKITVGIDLILVARYMERWPTTPATSASTFTMVTGSASTPR